MYKLAPIIYIVCMKKIILTLALAALGAHAADCLRNIFDIHESGNSEGTVKGMIIDSIFLQYRDPQHSVEFDNTKYYWTGDKFDSAVTYRKKHGSDDWEITVQKKDEIYGHREVTRDGNLTKILTTGGNPNVEELIYQEKDSINHVTKYVDPETGEVTNIYVATSVLRNDTIHKSENNGDDMYIIVRDSADENKCYVKRNIGSGFNDIDAIYEFEMKGDTLVDAETRPGGYQSTFMIFFVPINGSSSAIIRKNRPNYERPKSRKFDLLGRPAKGKYTVQFLK